MVSNRLGDFDLVIDPSDVDAHLVEVAFVHSLTDRLRATLAIGLSVLHPDIPTRSVMLHYSAAPEPGSMVFHLLASVLPVAGNLAEFTGYSLREVFAAIRALSPAGSGDASPTTDRLMRHEEFSASVDRLIKTASREGYSSVRLEIPGEIRIELKRTGTAPNQPGVQESSEVTRLRAELRAVEQEIKERQGLLPPNTSSKKRNAHPNVAALKKSASALRLKINNLKYREELKTYSQPRPKR